MFLAVLAVGVVASYIILQPQATPPISPPDLPQYSIALLNADHAGTMNVTQNVSGGSFAGVLNVTAEDDYLVMAVVDYRVVPFSYNDSYDSLHLVHPART
jgi:hypothetical protein